ncbi:endolytic transglycosylase MltG [Alkalibacter rhizosphaerae]|uniref:Endolytic transglycosylase MltG n=1 Tax=Alkalibacter rhizosphaerae TaxID=2815577 RepID=A0A974XLP1_9FIRM|nr:endolytic transglycosylase MltG [Alkalibacter rhizosphaerae]QSX08251.1 endolytic transglycosylase MltG [Alkalibacter rhizosphaerae]
MKYSKKLLMVALLLLATAAIVFFMNKNIKSMDVDQDPVMDVPSAYLTEDHPEAPVYLGSIVVDDGDTLDRDIIPQLVEIFGLTDKEVKEALETPIESRWISPDLSDYRRLEGIIPPGRYDIPADSTVGDWVVSRVKDGEKRFESIFFIQENTNHLAPFQQIILASMVEAECLHDRQYEQTAAVFLNRLEDKQKLQSCVTAEYALGFQRPFLYGEDVKIQSPYNTYQKAGLPIGPICSVDDESLMAAMSLPKYEDLYYFYYDYLMNEMFFYLDYESFKKEANKSRERFIDAAAIGFRDKINKQEIFGY